MEGTYQAFAARLALTSVSASIAEACTYPIDAVKTRMQLHASQEAQGQTGSSGRSMGAISTAAQVLKREGFKGLYAGMTPAIVRHIFYSGTRIAVYEHLRKSWQQQGQHSIGSASGGISDSSCPPPLSQVGLGPKLLMGLAAGATGQMVAVPADLIKVRLLADSRAVASGTLQSPRYKGMVHAVQTIVSQEGIMGLWRGGVPAVQRAALVNLGELATYDQAKQLVLASEWLSDGLATHAAASCASGLVATIVSTPADVIKTRLMGQDASQPVYKGPVDCLIKSVRQEGIQALYKGFFPTWMRLGPWQLVFWVTYEQMRKNAGLRSF